MNYYFITLCALTGINILVEAGLHGQESIRKHNAILSLLAGALQVYLIHMAVVVGLKKKKSQSFINIHLDNDRKKWYNKDS